MAQDDHAIVIGISRYPTLGDNLTPLDIASAQADVDAIGAWLTDKDGGDVPLANIATLVSTPPVPGQLPSPLSAELEQKLKNLDAAAQANIAAGRGARLGRRLYLYMSGHGFSPRQRLGCLYAANADPTSGDHVHATGWLSFIQDAGYFAETVLWLDCCMNRVALAQFIDTNIRPVSSGAAAGPCFAAFAAQRPLKAAECQPPQDAGRRHGVFTWALLEGLRGAAANAYGQVTGRSLADWLRHAQGSLLSDSDRKDPEVSRRPQIVQEDPELVFRRGVALRTYPVTLRFDAGFEGKALQILSGAPPSAVKKKKKIGAGPVKLDLAVGLYVLEVDSARQGFAVLGPLDLSITAFDAAEAPGAPSANGMYNVRIDAPDATTEIVITDGRFSLVEIRAGPYATTLPTGIYKISRRFGRDEDSRIVLVDRDGQDLTLQSAAPKPRTVAPINGSALTHEYHVSGDQNARAKLAAIALNESQSALGVIARVWSRAGNALPTEAPWRNVEIVNQNGQTVLSLQELASAGADPIVSYSIPVESGVHYLRRNAPQIGTVEQTLVLIPGWRFEVQMLWEADAATGALPDHPRLALSMWRTEPDDAARRRGEMARNALAVENALLPEALEEALLLDRADPLSAIVGGHLLLLAHERDPGRDLGKLNKLVGELGEILGPNHPDLAALALACGEGFSAGLAPITAPPMFARSWTMLLGDNATHLLAPEIWGRAAARLPVAPHLVWTQNQAAREQLFSAVERAVAPASPIMADLGIVAPQSYVVRDLTPSNWGGRNMMFEQSRRRDDIPFAALHYVRRRSAIS